MRAAAKRAALRAASLLTLCTAGAGCETAGGMAIRGPRRQARIWVVIQALRTGNFSVTGHTVRYTQGGRSYDETITVGNNRQKLVKANEQQHIVASRMLLVGANEDVVVKKVKKARVEGDSSLRVKGNRKQKIEKSQSLTAVTAPAPVAIAPPVPPVAPRPVAVFELKLLCCAVTLPPLL